MQISEVADLLSFPEDHIRLYRKQNLIPGIKRSDKSPNITEQDIISIKRIIFLRRLRWRFVDIAGYIHGKNSLFKTVECVVKRLFYEEIFAFTIPPSRLREPPFAQGRRIAAR